MAIRVMTPIDVLSSLPFHGTPSKAQVPASARGLVPPTLKLPPPLTAIALAPAGSRPSPSPRPGSIAVPAFGPSRDAASSVPSQWTAAFCVKADNPHLGSGGFAKIFRIQERLTGRVFAMKVMSRSNFVSRGIGQQLDAEIEAMRRAQQRGIGRHVVRLFDVVEERDHVYLRLELCRCDLLQLATCMPSSRLPEAQATGWMRQLMQGLQDLHGVGILHRDIKPENLLCAEDGTLRIADFGWCADICSAPASFAGTFQYMAPEILGSRGIQTAAVDVWSAAVTVLQLMQGAHFLRGIQGHTGVSNTDGNEASRRRAAAFLSEVRQRCPLRDEARPSYLSPTSWLFLRNLLVEDPNQRATTTSALQLQWLGEQQVRPCLDFKKCPSVPVLQLPTPARSVRRYGSAEKFPSRSATSDETLAMRADVLAHASTVSATTDQEGLLANPEGGSHASPKREHGFAELAGLRRRTSVAGDECFLRRDAAIRATVWQPRALEATPVASSPRPPSARSPLTARSGSSKLIAGSFSRSSSEYLRPSAPGTPMFPIALKTCVEEPTTASHFKWPSLLSARPGITSTPVEALSRPSPHTDRPAHRVVAELAPPVLTSLMPRSGPGILKPFRFDVVQATTNNILRNALIEAR